jgi:hypothetical protein
MTTQRVTPLTELPRIRIETCTGSTGWLTEVHGLFLDAILSTYYAYPGTIQPAFRLPAAPLPKMNALQRLQIQTALSSPR